jgi:nucleobase:cation symporter-1, NCS1 family
MTSVPQRSTTAGPSGPAGAVDQFGRVETKGIDVIDADSRHGRPRELFAVWLASNVAYIYIVVGGFLVVLGLSVWQATTVLLAGNLFWVPVGLLAASGPAAGTPSTVIMRAMFGIRGNRVFGAGLTWVTCVAYEGLNLAIGSLAGFALVGYWGVQASGPVKIAVAVLIGLATFTLSVYGHATIVRFSVILTVALGVAVVALGGFVLGHAHARPPHFAALHGSALWAAALIGFTAVAALPMSWNNGADYARYLPNRGPGWAVGFWTGLGGWLPATLLGLTGILAGTAVDMSDPQASMKAIVPAWFYAVFLLVLVTGSITNNVLTAYTSGLALQAVGVRASRARTVLIDAALGGALCAYCLLSAHFLAAMNNVLALTVAFLGPILAIYAADIVMRRNRYDGLALHDQEPGSRHWHIGGVNPAGVTAFLLGAGAALLCVNTTLLVGPVATALRGADISSIAGPVVAGLAYVIVSKSRWASAS